MKHAHRYDDKWAEVRTKNIGLLLWGGVGTVSYTHLDVYKRQGLHRLRGGVVRDAQPDAGIFGMEIPQLFGKINVDVYKRQVLPWLLPVLLRHKMTPERLL